MPIIKSEIRSFIALIAIIIICASYTVFYSARTKIAFRSTQKSLLNANITILRTS
jgi:hypothetical protein